MPRPKSIIPTYRLHKATGQAVAYVNRQEVYLGPHGSPESRQAYSELLDRLQAGLSAAADSTPAREYKTIVGDLMFRFVMAEAARYSSAEQRCIQSAVRVVREMYGETPAVEFGPLRLRAVRDAMIAKGWGRSFINKSVKRIRMIFRWAVGFEIIPPAVVGALNAVRSLTFGERDVPESRLRRSVSEADLQAVRAELCEKHRDMVDLLMMTGARSGELLSLTTGDIDRSGETWRAEVERHKTRHHGKSRILYFNATAQLILRKYLQADPAARLFKLRGDTFSKAIRAACVKVNVPEFTPHWLRHTVATRLADEVGVEGAQRLLGHSQAAMTRHYSQGAERAAVEAANKLG